MDLRLQGVNEDVDAGTEDITEQGGTYPGQPVLPTQAAEFINIVSGSANDAAAGTGQRTIRVEGLDANGLYVQETFTMNGTTPVVSTSTWTRVLRVFGLTAGSGGTNAGAITVKHNTTTANVFAIVKAGRAQSMMAACTVPTGRTAHVTRWGGQVYGLSATAAGEGLLELMVRATGANQGWRVIRAMVLAAVPTALTQETLAGEGLAIAGGSDVKVRFTSATANTFVLANLDINW